MLFHFVRVHLPFEATSCSHDYGLSQCGCVAKRFFVGVQYSSMQRVCAQLTYLYTCLKVYNECSLYICGLSTLSVTMISCQLIRW